MEMRGLPLSTLALVMLRTPGRAVAAVRWVLRHRTTLQAITGERGEL
jgi:hypothetical protein